MFFTQEDYRKIEKWLLANSVKDTEFAGASLPLKGNETVAFVQNGKNVNVLLKDLIEQIFLLGVSDFLNVTDKYGESRISLTQAIQLIPYKSRKIGQVITFLDEDGEWKLFQFQGERVNQWNNATLWVDLIERIQGISIIDSEDITATVDNLNQTSLTFADKNYNTTDYSGLGRVYLRKNIQRVQNPNTGIFYNTNLLTQQMLVKENTIYIVQYDYSLNFQTITIPDNCVLVFNGGSIDNGTLNCNSTIIVGKFIGNSSLTGTYTYQDAQADEEDITQNQLSVLKFKDKEYDEANFSGLGRTYLRKNIVNGVNILSQDMINNSNTIYHIQYDYNLNGQTITIPSGCVLLFEGGSIFNGILNGKNSKVQGFIRINNISLTGSWANETIDTNNIEGESLPEKIKIAHLLSKSINVPYGEYNWNRGVELIESVSIDFNNSVLKDIPVYADTRNKRFGNCNIFYSTSNIDIHIKNVTIKGSYDPSWGFINVNKLEFIPEFTGEKIFWFKNVNNIELNNVTITNLCSANGSASGIIGNYTTTYGYQPCLVQGAKNCSILNCSYVQSSLEEWVVIDCDKVVIDNCNFNCDYGVSLIGIVYCGDTIISNSKFTLNKIYGGSDTVNINSSNVKMSGCEIFGHIDIGNEYRNSIGTDFVQPEYTVENVTIDNCTITAIYVFCNQASKTSIEDFVARRNITVQNCIVNMDMNIYKSWQESHPGVTGFNLWTTNGENDENIIIKDNRINIINPYDNSSNLRLNLILYSSKVKGFTLSNNHITSDFSTTDDIVDCIHYNELAGVFTGYNATIEDLIIKNNRINAEYLPITFNNSTVKNCYIDNNIVSSNNFVYVYGAANLENIYITNNVFSTVSLNRTTTKDEMVYAKYESFFSRRLINSKSNTFKNINIKNNKVKAAHFVFAYIYQANVPEINLDFNILDNYYEMAVCDVSSNADTINGPISLGRADSLNGSEQYKFVGNTFINETPLPARLNAHFNKTLIVSSNVFKGFNDINFNTATSLDLSEFNAHIVNNYCDSPYTEVHYYMNTIDEGKRFVEPFKSIKYPSYGNTERFVDFVYNPTNPFSGFRFHNEDTGNDVIYDRPSDTWRNEDGTLVSKVVIV